MACCYFFKDYSVLFLIIIVLLVFKILSINNYELTLTNYRVVARKGLFTKTLFEMELHEIENITVRSNTITINGLGISISFPHVIDSVSFRKLILDTRNHLQLQSNESLQSFTSQAKFCRYCGNEIMPNSAFCPKCGKSLNIAYNPTSQFVAQPIQSRGTNQTTVVVQTEKSNSMGTAGFIFAILGLIVSWAPGVNFIIWFLGFIFSFIGLFKSPRGMAITGFILSILDIILIIIIFGSILAVISKFV